MMTENITQPTIDELRKMCQAKGLPADGTKKELVKRLTVATTASTNKFTGNGTLKCQICNLAVKIVNTKRKTLQDGRVLVTRQVKCTGKHGHTYSVPEILKN
jgi:membrane-bound inhibitor of C-type lysozyme